MTLSKFSKALVASAQALILSISLGGFAAAAMPAVALADGNCDTSTLTINSGANCANPGTTSKGLFDQGGIFQTIANVLIFLVGAVSVIMLIIGGLRYVISGGNSSAVTAAKDTILYAIIGIVVAVLSYAAVSFVISQLTKS